MEEFDGKRENKELFTAVRWTEPPVFQVIGHTEFSDWGIIVVRYCAVKI